MFKFIYSLPMLTHMYQIITKSDTFFKEEYRNDTGDSQLLIRSVNSPVMNSRANENGKICHPSKFLTYWKI